jgi:hypothetical protein
MRFISSFLLGEEDPVVLTKELSFGNLLPQVLVARAGSSCRFGRRIVPRSFAGNCQKYRGWLLATVQRVKAEAGTARREFHRESTLRMYSRTSYT